MLDQFREPETMRNPPHRDIELMAQIQVLDLNPAPRLEAIEDKRKEQVEQGKHRDGGCADSLSYCQARADGIFGKDRHFRTKLFNIYRWLDYSRTDLLVRE